MSQPNYSTYVPPKIVDAVRNLQEENETGSLSMVDIRGPFDAPRPSTSNRKIIFLVAFLVAFCFIYVKLIRTHHLNTAVIGFTDWLKTMHSHNPSKVYLIIFCCINVAVASMVISHSVVCILAALVLQDPLPTFFLLFFASIWADTMVYFVARRVLRDKIVARLRGSDLFMVLLEESRNEPYKTAFLTRLLFIPAGMKDYILATIDNKAPSFFSSAAVLHSFYILESILIARELSEIEQLLTHSQKWGEKTAMQKANFLVVLLFIAFTVLFVLAVGLWAKRKISLRQRLRQPMELNLKVC